MSRGIAAGGLTLVGLLGLVWSLPDWRVAFLVHHEPEDPLRWGPILVYAHILADLAWMAWARYRLALAPRRDLLAHHGLGLLAYGYALFANAGYGLVMLSLVNEIMPTLTGFEAWARLRERPRLGRNLARARLIVLVAWRLPVWIFALTMLIVGLTRGRFDAELVAFAAVAALCLMALIGLDLYWSRKSLRAWSRSPVTNHSRSLEH